MARNNSKSSINTTWIIKKERNKIKLIKNNNDINKK